MRARLHIQSRTESLLKTGALEIVNILCYPEKRKVSHDLTSPGCKDKPHYDHIPHKFRDNGCTCHYRAESRHGRTFLVAPLCLWSRALYLSGEHLSPDGATSTLLISPPPFSLSYRFMLRVKITWVCCISNVLSEVSVQESIITGLPSYVCVLHNVSTFPLNSVCSLLCPHPSFHLSTRSSFRLVYWYHHFSTLLSLKCAQRETHHLLRPAPTHSLQPSFSGHWLTMRPSFLPSPSISLLSLFSFSLFPLSLLPLSHFFSRTIVSVSPLPTRFLKEKRFCFTL